MSDDVRKLSAEKHKAYLKSLTDLHSHLIECQAAADELATIRATLLVNFQLPDDAVPRKHQNVGDILGITITDEGTTHSMMFRVISELTEKLKRYQGGTDVSAEPEGG